MIVEIIQFIAYSCWLMFLFWTLMAVLILYYKPKRSKIRASNVELVIVTIANNNVRSSLKETISNIEELGLKSYLLVDEGAELTPELPKENLIVVPRTYKPFLIAKGRAMNYFVENHAHGDKWYGFVDDDNLVLDDTFLYEIPYYEERGYVAMNAFLKMRKGRSALAYVMDSIRIFEELATFKFFTGIVGKPYAGLHGELLCVKGETLKEIGYDYKTITEDFHFSCELVKRGCKTWQSKTRVSLKSPNNLRDLMRQRARWFRGIILDLRNAATSMKLIMGTRVLFWAMGFFGSWAFAFLWPFWGTFWPAVPSGIAYWLLYSYGVAKAGKLEYFLLIPLVGVIEGLSLLITFRQKGFVVIDKH
jgi:beta-1,4-mannosyltransferase